MLNANGEISLKEESRDVDSTYGINNTNEWIYLLLLFLFNQRFISKITKSHFHDEMA